MTALKLPDTQPYRVVTVGASYLSPTESFDANGNPAIVQVYKLGAFGETIELTEPQANRLQALGVVKPVDAPKTYGEMNEDELLDLVAGRGISVIGSGANGAFVRDDLVNALETYDTGAGSLASPEAIAAATPAADVDTEGTVDDVLARVGDDPVAARQALDAEQAGRQRTTLIERLQAVIDA